MAFDCCLEGDSYEFDIIHAGPDVIVSALIGVDRVLGRTYFVHTALSPYDEGIREYSFCIVERDSVTSQQREYWSGRSVDFIPIQSRKAILSVVMAATEHLLSIAQPMAVYRCTYDAHPPDAALDKHHRISDVFRRCGYTVTRCDDWHGKRAWMADRTESG